MARRAKAALLAALTSSSRSSAAAASRDSVEGGVAAQTNGDISDMASEGHGALAPLELQSDSLTLVDRHAVTVTYRPATSSSMPSLDDWSVKELVVRTAMRRPAGRQTAIVAVTVADVEIAAREEDEWSAVVQCATDSDAAAVARAAHGGRCTVKGVSLAAEARVLPAGAQAMREKLEWCASATAATAAAAAGRPTTLVVRNFPIRWLNIDKEDVRNSCAKGSPLYRAFETFGGIRRVEVVVADATSGPGASRPGGRADALIGAMTGLNCDIFVQYSAEEHLRCALVSLIGRSFVFKPVGSSRASRPLPVEADIDVDGFFEPSAVRRRQSERQKEARRREKERKRFRSMISEKLVVWKSVRVKFTAATSNYERGLRLARGFHLNRRRRSFRKFGRRAAAVVCCSFVAGIYGLS